MPTIRTAAGKGAVLTPTEADSNMKRTPVEKTADYTLDATHNREFHYLTTAVATVTLPDISAITIETGDWEITLFNTLSTSVTISRNSQNINGSAANIILLPGQTVTICADATPDGFYTKSYPLSCIRVGKSAAQTHDTGTATWDVVLWDDEATAGFFDDLGANATGTGLITPPAWAKYFRVNASVGFAADADGFRTITLSTSTSSGGIFRAGNYIPSTGSIMYVNLDTGWIPVSIASSGFYVLAYQSSGGNLAYVNTVSILEVEFK